MKRTLISAAQLAVVIACAIAVGVFTVQSGSAWPASISAVVAAVLLAVIACRKRLGLKVLPRSLLLLIIATVVVVLLPAVGMLVPQVEWLRGFLLLWNPLIFVWMLVGVHHVIKFISEWLQ